MPIASLPHGRLRLPALATLLGRLGPLALLVTSACVSTSESDTSSTPDAGLPAEVTATLDLPAMPYPYASVTLPAHFQTPAVRAMDNTPADNPITDSGRTAQNDRHGAGTGDHHPSESVITMRRNR